MRTRNTDLSKSTPAKRTPPARKASTAKSTPSPSTVTPQASETKPGVATRSRQPKNTVSEPAEAKDSDTEEVTPEATSGRRYATRRASARNKTPTKSVSKRTPNSKGIVLENVIESSNNEDVKDADVVELIKEEEISLETVVESKKEKKETPVITVGVSVVEDGSAIEVADVRVTDDEVSLKEETVVAIVEETPHNNVTDSVREYRNSIEMAEVPDIHDEQLPMTNIGKSEKSIIQDKESPHLNASPFEILDEAVDKKEMKSLEIEKSNSTEEQIVEAQKGSDGHGEVKITDVTESRIEPSNMEEDSYQGEDEVEEVQKDLELGGNKTMEHTEGTKIQPSNVDKKPNEAQIHDGAQEELNEDRENKIMEVSKESKINLSNMEEDPNEAQVEGAQRELKDDEKNRIMENSEEVKINLSNMEDDLAEAQVEGTKGDLKDDEKNKIIENSEESKINLSIMDEDPNEAQVERAQGELMDDEKNKIMENSEESKINPSSMEEDPNEAQVEGTQGELKDDEKNKIMENSEESKIFPSNMEEDTNKDEDQVKRHADLKEDGEDKRTDLTDVSNIEPSSMENGPNEVQVVGARGELKNDKKKKIMEVPEESNIEPSAMKADFYEEKIGEDMHLEVDKKQDEELLSEAENQEEPEEEEEENAAEPSEESKTLEQEQIELTAIAQERKIEREHEIFVGGLDNDALEDDVRKVFEAIGEIVEVQMHKSSSTHQNKGYAFVKFANKEHAKRALSEMKNPVIHGKRCSTAPREDNNTLFVGNICNTWTKEAIKQKLNDYELEGVENITLVPDAQHDGLSRGFAFLEFSCHGDAMLAYKRLQQPDAIFGHLQRTVKVAFAEPLKVPSTDIMALVKSVFIDGLPPYWNEDRVRNHFKGYGEIERIMLARNMSTAKRKDFGFVDFTTHEAALACIESVNNTELGDGNSKMKVRARLSNPSPKIQAVKGGLYGGFRIGHAGGGSFSRPGKGIGHGGHALNHVNFQQGRASYQHGHNYTGRIGFVGEYDFGNSYPAWQNFERGGRGVPRGSHQVASRGAAAAGPSRPFLNRPGHNSYDIGRGEHFLPRRPAFLPEGGFDRPFNGSHFADPYLYDDGMHGIKRQFDMTQDPGYMEPSRVRPRFDYSGPPRSFPEAHYHDHLGGRRGVYPHDHYGPNFGGAAYSSFHVGNRPRGNGYGGDRPHGGNYGGGRPYRGGYN